ncbi:hypothetical protein [Actinokineospora sp. UTMC 2448]|uniref:hypothetical protein n=1 Tax=Actinokineospora sp. UTMC 2448 TaxID=2268449 RepID=UPI0021648A79|nr:hypothetical protein [Actinokineospora sp. UTMC 2448]UVS81430.1 hypothetical protein Actkin_05188 [Actinokineospora sp. UTMC 2448]
MSIPLSSGISFEEDEYGTAHNAASDSAEDFIGDWLLDDVQGNTEYLVFLVDLFQQFRKEHAREPYIARGNAWRVEIAPDAVEFYNMYTELACTVLPEFALSVMRTYWHYFENPEVFEDPTFTEEINNFREKYGRDPEIPW